MRISSRAHPILNCYFTSRKFFKVQKKFGECLVLFHERLRKRKSEDVLKIIISADSPDLLETRDRQGSIATVVHKLHLALATAIHGTGDHCSVP